MEGLMRTGKKPSWLGKEKILSGQGKEGKKENIQTRRERSHQSKRNQGGGVTHGTPLPDLSNSPSKRERGKEKKSLSGRGEGGIERKKIEKQTKWRRRQNTYSSIQKLVKRGRSYKGP